MDVWDDPVTAERRPHIDGYARLWLALIADAISSLRLREPGDDASARELCDYVMRLATDAWWLLEVGYPISRQLEAIGARIDPDAVRRAGFELACLALAWLEAVYGEHV